MIPAGFLQDLLSRVDIVDVVSRHVELKRGGANFMGLCPFHGEKSPSFSVSASKQFYYCFGCGATGDAIKFLTEHLGLSFVEAVRDLANQVGLQVPEEQVSPAEQQRRNTLRERRQSLGQVLTKAAEHYRLQLKASPRAIDYCKGRGLTGAIAARFGLGYAPPGWRGLASVFAQYDDPLLEEAGLVRQKEDEGTGEAAPLPPDRGRYDWFRDRLMFPIRGVDGAVIGFGGRVLDNSKPKYINSPETPVFSKGRELYGLFEARGAIRERGYVLVVEGYIDVVALAQSGFANAVATLGTACTAEHVQKLFRHTDQVVFSFDGDAAGRRAAARALEAALPHATDLRSVRFLFLPTEHDPDSYVRELGPAAFDAAIASAIPLSRQLLAQAAQDVNLDSAEGRARMLAQARPLWSALPLGALQRQILAELAREGGLEAEELAKLWQSTPAQGNRPAAGTRRAPEDGPPIDEPPPGDADPSYGAEGWDSGSSGSRYGGGSGGGSGSSSRWRGHDSGAGGGAGGGARGGRWPEGKGWRGRFARDDEAERPRTPRRAPAAPADLALRMLLQHHAWWDALSPADHDLLHQLEGVHGQAVAWLEREWMEHGAQTWTELSARLEAEPWAEVARAWTGATPADEPQELADLRRVLARLHLQRLDAESQRLSADPSPTADTLNRLREVLAEMSRLRAEVAPIAKA